MDGLREVIQMDRIIETAQAQQQGLTRDTDAYHSTTALSWSNSNLRDKKIQSPLPDIFYLSYMEGALLNYLPYTRRSRL